MSMEEPHAHMGESMESISAFSSTSASAAASVIGLFFSLSVPQFSPYPDVAFLGFLLIYAMFSKLSS
jgi:hypothetical protein